MPTSFFTGDVRMKGGQQNKNGKFNTDRKRRADFKKLQEI